MNGKSVEYGDVFQLEMHEGTRYAIGFFFPEALKRENAVKIGEIPVTQGFEELNESRHAPYRPEELIEFLQTEISKYGDSEYAEVLSKQTELLAAVVSETQ